MGRPAGARNATYEERRAALAMAVLRAMLDQDGSRASMAAMARGAGVTPPTLRHYFDDEEGMVRAALEQAEALGAVHLARARDPGDAPVGQSLRWLLGEIALGWERGVDHLHVAGLIRGIRTNNGADYVGCVLEPVLQAVEHRLAVHRGRGELRHDADLRAAALALLSPLILGLLHQRELGGADVRPLDLDSFLDAHVEAFCRGWTP